MDFSTLLTALLNERALLAGVLAYAWWAERKERISNAQRCAEERIAVADRLEGLKNVLLIIQERIK